MLKETKTFDNKKFIEKLSLVGLSYSNQSHRNFIAIHQNILTGETKIQPKTISLLPKRTEWKDGGRSGKIFLNGLTNKAKAKIHKACRVLEKVYTIEPKLKAYCSLITLTYGKDFPNDHESKKHLDSFFKRLRRKHERCKYVWVAEKQKRGAIHYHILTPYYTTKDFVNNSWNEIIQTWQRKNNFEIQTLLPNVIKVNSAGSYMAKYLQKEAQNIGGNGYGIDQRTRNLMKDQTTYLITHDATAEHINEVTDTLINKISNPNTKNHKWKSKYTTYNGAWLVDINHFALTEFIKYDRHDFGLITEQELLKNKIKQLQFQIK